MPRKFNQTQKYALFLASDGVCSVCGCDLEESWHADHVEPWSLGGETDVANGQALCPKCNRTKGTRMFKPRSWQNRVMAEYMLANSSDYLIEATPGAGKTDMAGMVCSHRKRTREVERFVLVVPTSHLKKQMAEKFQQNHSIRVHHDWFSGPFPKDCDGVAVTYQQVASCPDLFRKLCSDRHTMVVFDEIHHCADQSSWGEAIRRAFEVARYRLGLSGTPFRSDNNKIPFVRYCDGVGKADSSYDYGRALDDTVCRFIYFPRYNGEMEWASTSGDIVQATFDDPIAEDQWNQRLRTALVPSGGWMFNTLKAAHASLMKMREEDEDAGGLVLAIDQAHAENIMRVMRQHLGIEPVLVTSDQDDASKLIDAFRSSKDPWMVAIRMVSEGVDIPRLRIGVYATVTTTELFFRQAVGRFVRIQDDHNIHTAEVFIPDDPRLREFAERIKEQVNKAVEELMEEGDLDEDREREEPATDGPSFVPLSSTGILSGVTHDSVEYSTEELSRAEQFRNLRPQYRGFDLVMIAMMLRDAGAAPELPSKTTEPTSSLYSDDQKKLRNDCKKLVEAIHKKYSYEHKSINRILNERVGIKGVNDATDLKTLRRRKEEAQSWLKQGGAYAVA